MARHRTMLLAICPLILAFTGSVAYAGTAKHHHAVSRDRALAGNYTINHTDETPDECRISLLTSDTIGGKDVKLAKDCAKQIGWTGDITAWRISPDGKLVLANAERHAIIAFANPASEPMGTGPDGNGYMLYRAKAKAAVAKHRK